MNFRPLIGYLILAGSTLLLLAAELWAVYRLDLEIQVFLIGTILGMVLGIPISVRAWNYIADIITQKDSMISKDSLKLFGPRPFRWFFMLLILLIFFHPVQGSKAFLSTYAFAGSVLGGCVFVYFLFFILKVFLREHSLRRKIIIRVG
jgi:hypothetical protein